MQTIEFFSRRHSSRKEKKKDKNRKNMSKFFKKYKYSGKGCFGFRNLQNLNFERHKKSKFEIKKNPKRK